MKIRDTTEVRMLKLALTLKSIEAQQATDPEFCKDVERAIIDSELKALAKESQK
jgi:hypothetical protein